MRHQIPRNVAMLAMLLFAFGMGDGPPAFAQAQRIIWLNALCSFDAVGRHLHERLNQLATARQWQSQVISRGCEWTSDNQQPAARDAALQREAEQISAAVRARPDGATVVVLASSMVAARLGELRPAVLNPRLVARQVYLFATDPKVLCSGTPPTIRVGYLRNTARRVEIVSTLAFESKRPTSQIDAREVNGFEDFFALLGADGAKGLHVAALVADDIGGTYEEFKRDVIDPRNGVVKPVSLCQAPDTSSPPRLERRLDGSVSYLRVVAAPDASKTPELSLIALLRPGQGPLVVQQKGWWAWLTEPASKTVTAQDRQVRQSDFRDFPVLLAAGPSERALAEDPALKQLLSHCYFEGMYDAMAGGLSPCTERSDMLFGVYLLSAYLEDSNSAYKGCALQGYYELMSSRKRHSATATAKKNAEILTLKPALAACLSRPTPSAAPLTAVVSARSAIAATACTPSDKAKHEARDYGPHYAYYRQGMEDIGRALQISGPGREQSLRLAENCLLQAVERSRQRSCGRFTQGLFVDAYEPSLPLGMIRMKSVP